MHLSEQPAENDACLGYYGCTPTELLDEGVLGPRTTAVHATHLTAQDVGAARRVGYGCLLLPDDRA